MARLKAPDGRSGLILCRTSQATIDKGIPIITSGKGARVFDKDANSYLDLTSGVTRPVHIGHGRAEMGETIAKQAAELARDASVASLILTHLSRRHYEREVLSEAQRIFPNTFVARDFDSFQISKGGDVKFSRTPKGMPDL